MRYGASVLGVLAGTVVVAATQAAAGQRISPVAALCPAEAPTRENDLDGLNDRCVARSQPRCKSGSELRADVAGENDRCVAGGGKEGSKPDCPRGQALKAKRGEDVCERQEPPV